MFRTQSQFDGLDGTCLNECDDESSGGGSGGADSSTAPTIGLDLGLIGKCLKELRTLSDIVCALRTLLSKVLGGGTSGTSIRDIDKILDGLDVDGLVDRLFGSGSLL